MSEAGFIGKYEKVRDEKGSNLCVSLDPYRKKLEELGYHTENYNQSILDFFDDIIESTGKNACAIKINACHSSLLSSGEIKEITEKIHDENCIAIYDVKLGDIGASNSEAINNFKEFGFDAFTFSPFFGNTKEATQKAHENGLGIFVVTLPSDERAQKYFKIPVSRYRGDSNPRYLYETVAGEVATLDTDGVVIGSTNDVEDIRKIREILGDNKIVLAPGPGVQGGKSENILKYFSKPIIGVGRDIIYNENPEKKALEYNKMLM